MEVTLGGERLGSGKKNKVYMHNYERSTHDLSYIWRSTMASGTLVPFMSQVALPGDTFDINLNCEILTHPTIGPLFGTYKVQLDVFQIPIRLYQPQLHMNALNIGRDMSNVKLPLILMQADGKDLTKPIDNQQINPSCIFSYLGMRGLGFNNADDNIITLREFNAVPYLGYWDIYKNYYANKQEEIGAVIHKQLDAETVVFTSAEIQLSLPPITIPVVGPPAYVETNCIDASRIVLIGTGITDLIDVSQILFNIQYADTGVEALVQATDLFDVWEISPNASAMVGTKPRNLAKLSLGWGLVTYTGTNYPENYDTEPQVFTFDLAELDRMRMRILQHDPTTGPFYIADPVASGTTHYPYDLPLRYLDRPSPATGKDYTKQFAQEGLALKTYQSDLFNNWISTEWIDGADGISAITAVDTSTGSFTIDELNLNKKIYDMLNRIAISGGTYDDWLDAVYTHERTRSAENPMYIGGLIKNLVFQEVVSNSAAIEEPLGTLAGRGTMGNKHKGGHIIAKIDEPSYLMGIVSITPNIDYSQGNMWDTNLLTMNDFHKPALDAIGFQDLVTDQMAWFTTRQNTSGSAPFNLYRSAGKQPAWINYMTNVNKVLGNFAIESQQMYMVLNRRYSAKYDGAYDIKDLTTYIDPVKFNFIFADTRRDAQNFWAQISVNIEARRKMSAKVIPNL